MEETIKNSCYKILIAEYIVNITTIHQCEQPIAHQLQLIKLGVDPITTQLSDFLKMQLIYKTN